MKWNWQKKGWPDFRYNCKALTPLEDRFLHASGLLFGAFRHILDDDKTDLTVDLISDEALKTSEIEGEHLNRDSIQSSLRRQFGLKTDNRKVPPAEQGVAEMMTDLHRHFSKPLTHKTLYAWHEMLMSGRQDIKDVGRYRTHKEPMRVVSGPIHKYKIHFEAPPSASVKAEMKTFLDWLKRTAPKGQDPLPALTRAGMAHLRFVCIHPFEDGNGRIGRAVAEKALSECLGQPVLSALSRTIMNNRKTYYAMLEESNKDNEITNWLLYFAETVLEAQKETQRLVDFVIGKARFFDRFRDRLNKRQEKVILRMFREGPKGFTGGLSAENYITITKTSRATATRDLQDLIQQGALTKTGELKNTRYHLKIK